MRNIIETAVAILIMGLVFWVGIKIETIWRNCYCLKNIGKDIKGEKEISFWKHKKALLAGIAIAVFLIVGLIYYSRIKNRGRDELDCLQRIEYRGSTIYRIDGEGSRNFKTQDEAMNYCLKVLNRDRGKKIIWK